MKIENRTRFFLERINFGRLISLHCSGETANGVLQRVLPVTVTTISEDDMSAQFDPMMQMRPAQAQQLMDELWVIGFRPTQMVQGEGERGALQAHLQDMRHLVAKTLKMPLPGVGSDR